ncbi:NAD(P)-binding domain-containing protein [Algoriphagus aestuariicola]|uniref:NAD(P)-binding domain-containing protein n=2 Tax=Algoriphagus aestuariicola TaxID=1852016 RepID=A0ABS3BMH9_9BACT|nr:NAD(P)-binding domain-containing protein [Algoriphagus aestuariicola]
MKTSSKVAVIGLGNIGKAVAQILVKGNRPVILASKKLEDAEALAEELGSLATASETSEAIKNADILIFSVWFNTLQELIGQYGEALSGKIIIDTTNPIAPDENGGFKKIIGEKESSGQLNAEILPSGAKLVKAFGTLGVASLASAAFQSPEKGVLFYAADEESVDAEVKELIQDAGFEAVKVGGLDQSIRIEVFGDLHEFGALGKVVSKAEAIEKL